MREALACVAAASLAACSPAAPAGPGEGPSARAAALVAPAPEEALEVPPPPFSEGLFPCSACHEGLPVNRTRRELSDMHAEIVLSHDEAHRWCLDCHDADERDALHLAGGERVPFDQSYRLCGQCHGEKLRDWRAGVHGRRSGEWNGRKTYLLCAHCHDPHRPGVPDLAPAPPPRRPVGGSHG